MHLSGMGPKVFTINTWNKAKNELVKWFIKSISVKKTLRVKIVIKSKTN